MINTRYVAAEFKETDGMVERKEFAEKLVNALLKRLLDEDLVGKTLIKIEYSLYEHGKIPGFYFEDHIEEDEQQ